MASKSTRPPKKSLVDDLARRSLPPPDELVHALASVRAAPNDDGLWDDLEEVAAKLQRPEHVAALYAEVLREATDSDRVVALGERAVRFHDEWFEDASALVDVLRRVLDVQPEADWAFHRLTLIFTNGGRWDDLLALYDSALANTDDKTRRKELLDEAAHVAKDFAGQSDRAIQYLEKLMPLRPQDAQLAASLERLFEKQGRYRDLVDLWTTRLSVLAEDAARTTRVRIAECWLQHLGDPVQALEAVAPLLDGGSEGDAALALIESVAKLETVDIDVRRRALGLLRDRYATLGRAEDVVRVLETSLEHAEPGDRAVLLRELVPGLRGLGRDADALERAATLLVLEPDAEDARNDLADLAAHSGNQARRAEALAAAADAAEDAQRAIVLRVEAGDVRCDVLGDEAKAIDLYARVFADEHADAGTLLVVARKLAGLLDRAGRSMERLDVLERLALLEPDDDGRRAILADAARLADGMGEADRAVAAWGRRLGMDDQDAEALDALVDLLARLGRHSALIETLQRRVANASDEASKRADLVRVANIEATDLADVGAAIKTWNEIESAFGRNGETIGALADLMMAAEQWKPLTKLLKSAAKAETDPSQRAIVLARLGDVHRTHLDNPPAALDCYRDSLDADPREPRARAGLGALLDVATCASPAVDALARAFATTDEWAQTLSILDHRVAAAADDAARTELLLEAARIAETRGEDPVAALTALGRAMPLAPERTDIEQELLRLAGRTSRWDLAVEAYRGAIQGAGDPERVADLATQLGSILETRIADLGEALHAYGQASKIRPASLDVSLAVVRVASQAGVWNEAARALVESALARDAVEQSLVSEIEAAADATAAWDMAAASLRAAIAAASAIASHLARQLETLLALWHRDRRRDADAAEAALVRAAHQDGSHVPTLRMLAELQRRNPGRPLVDTLLVLVDAAGGDLDALYEAAQTTLRTVEDEAFARTVLERLFDAASRRWVSPESGDGAPPLVGDAKQQTSWSVSELVRLCQHLGDHSRAVELLATASALPFSPEESRELRHQAASIAALAAGDPARAIDLWKGLLDEVPQDARAITELANIYAAQGRTADLLGLRRHELSLERRSAERLALRLEIARLLGVLEDVDGRVSTLRENLQEHPGHAATIGELSKTLERGEQWLALVDVLSEQAAEIEASDSSAAASLWARAAELAEQKLSDVPRAIAAHGRVVALARTTFALDALARLHVARKEFAAAVGWLEQRLEMSDPSERAATVARLAEAHLGAGQRERALEVLEAALATEPRAIELRTTLGKLYRTSGAWEPLARSLTDGAEHAPDDASRVEDLREAAEIYLRRLARPEAAVPLLERCASIAADDRTFKTMLAEALRLAGRLDEARQLLETLVEGFGRRRPPERAQMHLELAHIARARNDVEEALGQLEVASKMDVGSAQIMQLLGDMAREGRQLDRAERAYRALLLIVRRQVGEGRTLGEGVMGPSEVLFALHEIATELGQAERAQELLESAFETASAGDEAALHFEQMLRASGRHEMLLRSLDNRLARVTDPAAAAAVHVELSELHASLGRTEEALGSRLSALAYDPGNAALHESTVAVAAALGAISRYAEELDRLARRAKEAGDAALAADLYLRLGALRESELGDAGAAASAYAAAEETGERLLESVRALDRLYGALGDAAGQARVLRKLVDANVEASEMAEQTEALYRLAQLELAKADTTDSGADTLAWGIDRDPQYERALGLLRGAAALTPQSSRVTELFERVARAVGDDRVVLEALVLASAQPEPSGDMLREAVDIATRVEDHDAAERLLRRAIAVARERDALADAVWALVALAARRKAAGDLKEALQCLRDAALSADAGEAYTLGLEAAALAAGPAEDLHAAAEILERLLERDAADRAVWEPLLDVYRRLGDLEKLEALIAVTVDATYEPADRNRLRLERARLLLGQGEREDDAIQALRDVLDEDPGHGEAGALLMDLYEKRGQTADLTELLYRQLDVARDRQDGPLVASVSHRLGTLLALDPERRDDAMDVLRSALDWVATDRLVLESLLGLYGPDHDAVERADTMEKLLGVEAGEKAAALAGELAGLRETLDDVEGVVRALDTGFRAYPEDETLRRRLDAWYREREDWTRLAEMLVFDGQARTDRGVALARYREASTLYLDRLGDPGAAALVLGRARALDERDMDLLGDYVRALGAAADFETAISELTGVLDGSNLGDKRQAHVLSLLGETRVGAGDLTQAVADLEQAYALGGTPFAKGLGAGLERLREQALGSDRDAVRATTLRLVQVLPDAGDAPRATELLVAWVSEARDDRDALLLLADRQTSTDDWNGAADTFAMLSDLAEGEEQVDLVMKLADACEKAGRPGDARERLERVHAQYPDREEIRLRLRQLYEASGAFRELADLFVADAEHAREDSTRFEALLRAGEMYLRQPDLAALALPHLEQALALRPGDQEATLLLADGYVAAGRLEDAAGMLDPAIRAHRGRRSRELGALQHRMARVAYAMGDRQSEMAWLGVGLESDPQSGLIASELAEVAMEQGAIDVATKALRAITLMKSPGPMSRAEAFLRQGMIAHQQGDAKKAVFMANKALTEDPNLEQARDFLAQLGA